MAHKTTKELLIIHQGALGDFVAIFPAIVRLKKYYDRIDVVCQNQLGKLAAALQLINNWYPLEAASFASLYAGKVAQKVADLLKKYDTNVLFSQSVELERSIRQITASLCYRIPPKPPADKAIHITHFAFHHLIRLGLLNQDDADVESLSLQSDHDKITTENRDRAKIVLHPGSGSIRKRWPLSQFKQIELVLKSKGLKPEFVLGPAEMDLKTEFEDQERTTHVFSDLLDLVALFKSAGGFVGNDSGASHLAAFMGLPSVVIFGPADPQRWKPSGPQVEVVRPGLECQACFEIEPSNCPEPKCLDDTTPTAVIEAFYRIYDAQSKS